MMLVKEIYKMDQCYKIINYIISSTCADFPVSLSAPQTQTQAPLPAQLSEELLATVEVINLNNDKYSVIGSHNVHKSISIFTFSPQIPNWQLSPGYG